MNHRGKQSLAYVRLQEQKNMEPNFCSCSLFSVYHIKKLRVLLYLVFEI